MKSVLICLLQNSSKDHQIEQQMQIIKQINIETEEGVECLIKFLKDLSPEDPNNFIVIKKLIQVYGLPILIYLQSFYKGITASLAKDNKMLIQQIASLAADVVMQAQIPKISFLFEHGTRGTTRQIKKIPLTEEQVMFGSFIVELSCKNAELNNHKIGASQYQQFLLTYLKSQYLTILMKRSIQDFRISKQQIGLPLSQTLTSSTNLRQESSDESEVEDEPFDFYTHQNTTVLKQKSDPSFNLSIDSSVNSVDFSQKNSYITEMTKMLCCRTFFYENQAIRAEQNLRVSFLQAHYPFSEAEIQSIKKIMCSFLNCEGGHLFIGIRKPKHGLPKIVQEVYTESQREEIQKSFRMIAQGIEPEILTKKMYNVEFVPIREQSGIFIPGGCIIRVTVSYGIRDEIYSYSFNNNDCFPFRAGSEVIEKKGRSLLIYHKCIVKNQLPIPKALHLQPCLKPQIGQLLHSTQNKNRQHKKNKKSVQEGETEEEYQNEISLANISDPMLQLNRAKPEKISHCHSLTMSKKSSAQVHISAVSTQDSHSSKVKNVYFFVVGLDENQLTPLFAERNLLSNVKIQSSKEKQLVTKVHGEEYIAKVRKMLLKIQSKYAKERNVKVYEMSLELEIDKNYFNQAIQRITALGISYKVYQINHVKFKLFRDSFQAFIELESRKIPVRFVHQSGLY